MKGPGAQGQVRVWGTFPCKPHSTVGVGGDGPLGCMAAHVHPTAILAGAPTHTYTWCPGPLTGHRRWWASGGLHPSFVHSGKGKAVGAGGWQGPSPTPFLAISRSLGHTGSLCTPHQMGKRPIAQWHSRDWGGEGPCPDGGARAPLDMPAGVLRCSLAAWPVSSNACPHDTMGKDLPSCGGLGSMRMKGKDTCESRAPQGGRSNRSPQRHPVVSW